LEERALLANLTIAGPALVPTQENDPAFFAAATGLALQSAVPPVGPYDVQIKASAGSFFAPVFPGLLITGSGTNTLQLNGPLNALKKVR